LASTIKEAFPRASVEIFDGQILTSEQISSKINADIIGLSVMQANYEASLEIAKLSKAKGIAVVMGGHYATPLFETILRNRDYVDFVIIGDGCEAIVKLMKGDKLENIENLVYKEKGQIKSINKKSDRHFLPKIYSANSFVDFNYGLVDIKKYSANFMARFPDMEFPFPLLTHRGCKWREESGCIFCSIFGAQRSQRQPKKVWKQIDKLMKYYGASFFWDIGDSFTGDIDWVRKFLNARPASLSHIKFYIYARPDELLKPGMMELLRKLNVEMIYVGFESGNQIILNNMNKGTAPKDYERLIKLIQNENIKLCSSIVLGAPSESERSVEKTIKMCNKMKRSLGEKLKLLNANILVPYPGSKAFNMLLEKCPYYSGQDMINQNEIIKDWLRYFGKFDQPTERVYSYLHDACKQLNELGEWRNAIHE